VGHRKTRLQWTLAGRAWVFGAAVSLAVLWRAPAPAPSERHASPTAVAARVEGARATMSRLPVRFEPNVGQFDGRVRYLARAGQATLFLTDDESVLAFPERSRQGGPLAVRLRMARARATTPRGATPLVTRTNYFFGSDASHWYTDVTNYGRVVYPSVREGVDLVYHGEEGALEYDLLVAPGVDPASLSLEVDGSDGLSLTLAGDLVIATAAGRVVQPPPHAYQTKDGRQVDVPAGYRLVDGGARIAFEIAPYDRSQALVIDPVIAYGTYLGQSGGDKGAAIDVDSSGSVYVAGTVYAADFPPGSGPYASYVAGSPTCFGSSPAVAKANILCGENVFVAKLNPAGSALDYATYLGPTAEGAALAVDHASGAVYVAGAANVPGFPTQNALYPTAPSGQSGFVAELAPSGSSLVFSTYFGGNGTTGITALALDAAKNIHVAGQAGFGLPTKNAFDSAYDNGACPTLAGQTGPNPNYACNQWDGFVAEMAPSGAGLIYSSYLGGTGTDAVLALTTTPGGDAFVTGTTNSTDFPTKNALYAGPTLPVAGESNGFVAHVGSTGDLVYSTYLGDNGGARPTSIAVDSAGNAYVGGAGASVVPETAGAYQGTGDWFIAKFNPQDSAVVFLAVGVGGQNLTLDGQNNVWYTAGGTTVGELSADGSRKVFEYSLPLATGTCGGGGMARDDAASVYLLAELCIGGAADAGTAGSFEPVGPSNLTISQEVPFVAKITLDDVDGGSSDVDSGASGGRQNADAGAVASDGSGPDVALGASSSHGDAEGGTPDDGASGAADGSASGPDDGSDAGVGANAARSARGGCALVPSDAGGHRWALGVLVGAVARRRARSRLARNPRRS